MFYTVTVLGHTNGMIGSGDGAVSPPRQLIQTQISQQVIQGVLWIVNSHLEEQSSISSSNVITYLFFIITSLGIRTATDEGL